jgi:hypothetical protein
MQLVRPMRSERWVRITHPFHPLRGHQFRFVVRNRLWGEERVLFLSRGEMRAQYQ